MLTQIPYVNYTGVPVVAMHEAIIAAIGNAGVFVNPGLDAMFKLHKTPEGSMVQYVLRFKQ